MNTHTWPENSGIQPFATDLDYVMAEVGWIGVRSRRIEAQRGKAERDDFVPRRGSRHSNVVFLPAGDDRAVGLQADEDTFRAKIDAKLKLNRSTGPGLGLDRICQEFGLNDFERALLLLGFIPCLGSNASMDSISKVDPISVTGSIYIEAASMFLELSPREHLQSLLSLLPDGPLLTHGLVRLSYDPTSPAEVVNTGVELTGKALAAITGIPGFSGFGKSLLTCEQNQMQLTED